jgi:hypothetical protein
MVKIFPESVVGTTYKGKKEEKERIITKGFSNEGVHLLSPYPQVVAYQR